MESYIRVMDIMSKKPVMVGPETTIEESVKLMLKEKVGSLLIQENNILKGIATEKDFVEKAILNNLSPKKAKIKEIMNKVLITIEPDADVMDAVKTMTKYEIRRLPVVDKKNKLFGLLTINDILRVQPELFDIMIEKSRLFGSRRSFTDGLCASCREVALVRAVNGRMLCQDCERNERVINYLS